MTSRTLLILSIAAILAVGAGLWFSRQPSSPSAGAYGELYPRLKEQLGSISAVRIFDAGEVLAVELVPEESPQEATPGKRWGVAERAGYPADESMLRQLLLSIAEATIYEEKTSNPEQYATLGVEDVSAADASGIRIELTGPQPAVNLIVGKHGVSARSTYVRRAAESRSWLIDTRIDADTAPDAWLRESIIDVSADRIQSAAVNIQGAGPYTAAKAARADADFAVTGLPRGKSLSSPSAANGFATALAGLALSDVQTRDDFGATPPEAQASFMTFDGLVVTLDGWTRDDEHFIALQATFDPAQAEKFKIATAADAGQAESAADAKEPQGQTGESMPSETTAAAGSDQDSNPAPASTVQQEIQATQARVEGWVYQIPDYKYEGIFKPLDDLLAP